MKEVGSGRQEIFSADRRGHPAGSGNLFAPAARFRKHGGLPKTLARISTERSRPEFHRHPRVHHFFGYSSLHLNMLILWIFAVHYVDELRKCGRV